MNPRPKLALALAAAATLGIGGAAFGALPRTGPFAGKTSLHSINGFPDVVTFVASPGGRTLRRFSFGTLGCFGTGSFPAGVDPYADADSVGTVGSVPVSATGTFLLTGVRPRFAAVDGIVTSATIKGTFTSSGAVTGTISISQDQSGDTCGPMTMRFSAAPGTPTSLGLTGP